MLKRPRYLTLVVGFVALWSGSVAAGPTPITAKAETKDYQLELDIGGIEKMYTKEQAATLHPTDGEIMVSGTMAGMPLGDMQSAATMANMQMSASASSADDTSWRDVEVHILSKTTSNPIRGVNVSIILVNSQTNHQEVVPIAVMYGVRAGAADWHYGNNVMLPTGKYRVDVSAKGEKTTFDITVPAS